MILPIIAGSGDLVLLLRTEHGGGSQVGTRSCLKEALWTLCMIRTVHGSCLDFLLAEHLTVRGLFIYLPRVACSGCLFLFHTLRVSYNNKYQLIKQKPS